MTRPINCPQCGLPTVVPDEPASASGDTVCAHCGVRIAQNGQGAPRVPTVLCIDDDPLVLHFYRDFLARHGYRVLTAIDGLPGLDLARRERPRRDPPGHHAAGPKRVRHLPEVPCRSGAPRPSDHPHHGLGPCGGRDRGARGGGDPHPSEARRPGGDPGRPGGGAGPTQWPAQRVSARWKRRVVRETRTTLLTMPSQ